MRLLYCVHIGQHLKTTNENFNTVQSSWYVESKRQFESNITSVSKQLYAHLVAKLNAVKIKNKFVKFRSC